MTAPRARPAPTARRAGVRVWVLAVLLLASCRGRPPAPTHPSPSLPPSASPTASPSVSPSTGPQSPVPGQAVLRFAAVGDVGEGNAGEAQVARAIASVHAKDRLDVLLLLGDLVYPDGDPAAYRTKFGDPYAPVLGAGIPLLATLGNHDIRTDSAAFQRLFGMPAPYYTTVRGPVEFFVLNTSRGSVDLAQRAWLEGALQASTSSWKIAVMHVPLFSSGVLHGSNRGLQTLLKSLFERYRVQLVIGGHDHDYERTNPIGGVTYVVSGGGCCPRKVGRSAFTAASAEGLHFVVVDVGPDELRLRAETPSGMVLDRAAIPRLPVPAW